MLATRDRVEEIRELEALWDASPDEPTPSAALPRGRSVPSLIPRVPGSVLAFGWLVFLAAVIIFEPAPNPEAVSPFWAEVVAATFLLALAGAAICGRVSPPLGFAGSSLAGSLGMALSVACSSTGHHLGSWWLVELGATAALTALSAAGLATRLRNSRRSTRRGE